LYFWNTKLYFKSGILETLILYLMHFSYPEAVLRSNWRYT